MDLLEKEDDCVIYSIGGNNRWEFELDLLRSTECHVHTFDCTGDRRRFRPPESPRQHFHHTCLGPENAAGLGDKHPKCSEGAGPKDWQQTLCGDTKTLADIQRELGHRRVDLLKIDIEGWEWPIFDVVATDALMPMQVLIEVHYGTYRTMGTKRVTHTNTTLTASDLARFQSRLISMGYVVAKRDDNPICKHCTELTLLRVAC